MHNVELHPIASVLGIGVWEGRDSRYSTGVRPTTVGATGVIAVGQLVSGKQQLLATGVTALV